MKADPARRGLDFGAGQLDHVYELQSQGVNILGVEPFYRSGELKSDHSINTTAVHRMIDDLCASLRTHGLFDLVNSSAVINSVVDKQAEADVLTVISALTRRGGMTVYSGRSREYRDARRETDIDTGEEDQKMFFDDYGFVGAFRDGTWFFQLFHNVERVFELAAEYVSTDFIVTTLEGRPYRSRERNAGYFVVVAKRNVELAPEHIEAALRREFDLT